MKNRPESGDRQIILCVIKGQHDIALVSDVKDKGENVPTNSSEESLTWFAETLEVLKIGLEEAESGMCNSHRKKSRIECAYDGDKELCFVQ